ncbi:MAG: GGDEF domain-containing protein [Acidiferrobacterales bacterium]
MAASSDQWLKSLQVLAMQLRADPSGASHAKQLQQLLDKWHSSRAAVDQDFIIQLSFFLGTLSGQVKDPKVTALIAELMQNRAAAMRSTTTSTTSESSASSPPGRSAETKSPAEKVPRQKIEEEFIDFSDPDHTKTQSYIQRPPAPSTHRVAEPTARTGDRRSPVPPRKPDAPPAPSRGATSGAAPGADAEKFGRRSGEPGAGPGYPDVERRVNSAYRLHLNRKHDEIEKLQGLLAQKASEALSQNKQFGDLLKTERAALEKASNANDIDEMKQILIGSADELLAGQRDLEDKLRSSFEYLEVVKSDSENLHNELTKVRLLSMTDENTGLPNRRAFLRRLEEEIARARQYNIPLTLALIDLDFFKEINDQYGHPAGDAVLSWYAQHGLPVFRHYDMIARYGGEEFAVLFPGTTAEGAGRAIAKLREHIAHKTCTYEDEVIRIPTFSAGLATYRDNEDGESLIKRADQALYRAKSQGRDQTALEQRLPPVEGAKGREP